MMAPLHKHSNLEVHLLGCDEGPGMVAKIHKAFPFVRGCDTALAFICAQAGINEMGSFTSRPAGEIDFLKGTITDAELECTMKSFEQVVGVTSNKYDLFDKAWNTSVQF
jgi:hypothetical protein